MDVTHEVVTKDGYVDVIDSDTREIVAHKVRFRANKTCTLCGGKFTKGELIEASFPVSIDMEQCLRQRGPWMMEAFQADGSGGSSSMWLRNNAIKITECATGTNLYDAPYSRTFIVNARKEARARVMKSIIQGFLSNRSY
jgi:hypothetical protein